MWNDKVYNIYRCGLELLTSMPECKLAVLSWRCFLTWSRSCSSIDIPVCSNCLTRLWAITGVQPNSFAGHIALGTAATFQKPSYTYFDVHVALVQYSSLTFLLILDVLTRMTPENCVYESCSNMNASSFITFFTYVLRQNGKHFYKGQYVTFKLAQTRKKSTVC